MGDYISLSLLTLVTFEAEAVKNLLLLMGFW